jgi:hypothetical protein
LNAWLDFEFAGFPLRFHLLEPSIVANSSCVRMPILELPRA